MCLARSISPALLPLTPWQERSDVHRGESTGRSGHAAVDRLADPGAGVTQLNRNGNKAHIDLADRVTKLEDDLKTTQDEIVKVKDETILVQEQMVRDLAVTGSRQTNMERVKSNIREILSRVQYQLAALQETVKNAEQTAQQCAAEIVAEQKILDTAKAEVETLKVQNSELMNRLTSLRNELKTTMKASLDMLDMLGRAVKVPSKAMPG